MANFYFSTEQGMPIARIYDRDRARGSLRITNQAAPEIGDLDPITLVEDLLSYEKDQRRIVKTQDRERIIESITSEIEPRDPRLKRIYQDAMSVLKEREDKEFFLHSPKQLQPIPIDQINQVDIGYICGPAGSGKSTYAARWLLEYHDMYKDRPIYVFSRKVEDPAIDVIPNVTRILLDKSFISFMREMTDPVVEPIAASPQYDNGDSEDNISDISDVSDVNVADMIEPVPIDPLTYFARSCCVFDDVDTIGDKEVRERVQQLKNDLLETGRASEISVLVTSHLITDFRKTRAVLNEASFITVFPSVGNKAQIDSVLVRCIMLPRQQINRILKLPSRWVTIYRRAPQYVIYEGGAYFL